MSNQNTAESVNRFHDKSDKDTSAVAQHHTLGSKKNQASPGNHTHDGTTSLRLSVNGGVFSTTAQNTLTAAEALIASVSFNLLAGRAYKVYYACKVTVNGGTSPFAPFPKLRRLNATGTVIHDPGATAIIGANSGNIKGTVYLQCSADTTQTLALTVSRNTTGSPTSISINGSTVSPTMIVIQDVGPSSDYTGAMEVPTA
jgi:hypothetical protein